MFYCGSIHHYRCSNPLQLANSCLNDCRATVTISLVQDTVPLTTIGIFHSSGRAFYNPTVTSKGATATATQYTKSTRLQRHATTALQSHAPSSTGSGTSLKVVLGVGIRVAPSIALRDHNSSLAAAKTSSCTTTGAQETPIFRGRKHRTRLPFHRVSVRELHIQQEDIAEAPSSPIPQELASHHSIVRELAEK